MPKRITLNTISTGMLECIANFRHDVDIVEVERRTEWGVPVSYRCMSCGTYRYDTIDLQGHVSTRRYELSRPYETVLAAGFTRADCRLELVRRARVALSEKRKAKSNVVSIHRAS